MPHLRSKRRFVVRVCKEVEYCRDHRCIQKCCPTDADDGGSYICSHIAKSKKNFYEEISNITGGTLDMTGLYRDVARSMAVKLITFA